MSELTIAGSAIDGKGLVADIPDNQLDTAAEQLAMIGGALDLAAGDLYILKCKALGIEPGWTGRGRNSSPADGKAIELETFCYKLGKSRSRLENDAAICRKWPYGDRVSGMTKTHYETVAGMEREAARQLLLRAQMGDPKGKFDAPGWKVWSVARLRKERKAIDGDAQAKLECDNDKTALDTQHEILNDVAKILGKETPKNKKIIKKIERGVEKAFKEIKSTFEGVLESEVEKEKAKYKKASQEHIEQRNTLRAIEENCARPLEYNEWQLLRNFCHPDRHKGNEAKAGQAYEIVQRLGNRVGFNNKRSAILQSG